MGEDMNQWLNTWSARGLFEKNVYRNTFFPPLRTALPKVHEFLPPKTPSMHKQGEPLEILDLTLHEFLPQNTHLSTKGVSC